MDRVVLQQQLLAQTDADKRGLFSSKDAWKSRYVTLYNDRITLHKGQSRQGEGIVLDLKGFKTCRMDAASWKQQQQRPATVVLSPNTSLSNHLTLSLRRQQEPGHADDADRVLEDWYARITERIQAENWGDVDGISMQAHMQRASLHAQHRRQGSKEHRKSASIHSEPQTPTTISSPSSGLLNTTPPPPPPNFDIKEILSSLEARDMAVHDAFSASFFNKTSPRASSVRRRQQEQQGAKENLDTASPPAHHPHRPKLLVVSRPVESTSWRRDSGTSFGSAVSDSKRNSAHEATIYAVDEYAFGSPSSSPLASPVRARFKDAYRSSPPAATTGLGLNVL